MKVVVYCASVPHSSIGTYMGHECGMAVVDFDGRGLTKINPCYLTEAVRIKSKLDWLDFDEGYCLGIQSVLDDDEIGGKSQGNIPTAFSRGFLKGRKDATSKLARPFSVSPYNEVARWLFAEYPGEYEVEL